MDQIKEAFSKVKKDIEFLQQEHIDLGKEIIEIKKYLVKIDQKLDFFVQRNKIRDPTHLYQKSSIPTHNPTHKFDFKPLKHQILDISKGNEGVPTDRQTDRQTDISTQNLPTKQIIDVPKDSENSIDNALEILESLDNIKKEIRLKFKRLTEQELLVFSAIYQIEEEKGYVDHKLLSERLNLSESSIRDYVGRLIKKGIPIEKTKINNKSIHLSISQNLKKIATLSTILKLRDL